MGSIVVVADFPFSELVVEEVDVVDDLSSEEAGTAEAFGYSLTCPRFGYSGGCGVSGPTGKAVKHAKTVPC